MYSNELDDSTDVELTGITKYTRNINFFRTNFTSVEYANMPRRSFVSFYNAQDYVQYHSLFPRVVFIDLSDVRMFLAVEKRPGLSEINVMKIAAIVCTFIGDNSMITDVLWNTFEEEITSAIMAELGIDGNSLLMSDPFNEAIAAVFDIATIVARYLIHAQYPLVEGESIYGPAKYENGIIALVLKEYSVLANDYHKVEYEFAY